MKFNNKIYSIAIALGVLISACDSDDFTGESRLKPTSPTITVDASSIAAGTTVSEGDEETFDIEVTLSEAQIVDVAVYVVQVGGDAVAGEDYDVATRTIIPKGETSATITVSILTDCGIEASKTLELQVGDDRTANADITPVTLNTITIENSVGEALDVTMEWVNAGDEVVGGLFAGQGPYALADIDLLLYSVEEDDVIDAGATLAAEHLSLEGLPDGEYILYADFWEQRVDIGEFLVEYPITLTFERCGSIDAFEIVQEADIYNSDSPTSAADPGDAVSVPLASIVVTDGTYEIFNLDDESVGSGRSSKRLSSVLTSDLTSVRRVK